MTAQPAGRRQPTAKPDAPRRRRQFAARYKLQVLAEYDTLTTRADKTALLRRENLTASQISRWRAEVYEAALQRLGAEPGSQPGHVVHASTSLWQQFSAVAGMFDPPMSAERLLRAVMRYYAGLTAYLPPKPELVSPDQETGG